MIKSMIRNQIEQFLVIIAGSSLRLLWLHICLITINTPARAPLNGKRMSLLMPFINSMLMMVLLSRSILNTLQLMTKVMLMQLEAKF